MKIDEIRYVRILEQARTLVREEKFLHAFQQYYRLLDYDSRDISIYLELSSVLAECGMISAAIQLLLRANKSVPGNDDIIFHIGNYYLAIEDYDAALRYYKKLSDKKIPHIHFNMGIAYFYKQNFKYAEEQFRLTLRLDPKFPKINESLGELLIKRQAYTEAIQYLRQGAETDPYSAVNHYLLGTAYSRLDQWKKAYQEFVTAIDLDPNEPSGWQMCGEALIQMKQYNEAEAYLRKTLELAPQSVETLVDLGCVLSIKGDTERSNMYLEKAFHVDSVHARAREAQWKARQLLKK